MLDKIPKISFDHWLRNHAKVFNHFLVIVLYRKMGVALPHLFGRYEMLEKSPKLVWTIAYSMQREFAKNQPFSCNNFLKNQGF